MAGTSRFMKSSPSALFLSLAMLGAGCLSPVGYLRPDGGTSPAEGGSPGGSGTGGTGPALGGSPGATGGSVTVGHGGSVGTGGGTGGTVVSTGSGGSAPSGTGGAPPPPPGTKLYTDDFESDAVGVQAADWIQDTIDSDTTKGTFSVVSDNGNQVLQGRPTAATSSWTSAATPPGRTIRFRWTSS
jgi:hypothetical protein